MIENRTELRVARIFLCAACYLPLFIVFFIAQSLFSTYNVSLYRTYFSYVNGATGVMFVGLIASQATCLACLLTACAGWGFRTLKRPQWRYGGLLLAVMWLIVAAGIVMLQSLLPQ